MPSRPPNAQVKVFVLMPFKSDFDDVYMIIRDACQDSALVASLRCLRADEISKPGRITEQIISSIQDADVVIADLTGSNPNVMYELGYAHALQKHTIIINQSITTSPFDVQSLRQIPYDRNRLVKECRPQIVKALRELVDEFNLGGTDQEVLSQPGSQTSIENASLSTAKPVRANSDLVAQLQQYHLRIQLANKTHNTSDAEVAALEVIDLIKRVSVFSGGNPADQRNVASVLGNCAVEMERAQLYEHAENAYKHGIAIAPSHAGVHLQYSDFLVDQERFTDAAVELERARQIAPDDRRADRVELKLQLRKGGKASADTGLEAKLRAEFEKDRTKQPAAAAYLLYLSRSGAPPDEFMRVCQEWEDALPKNEKNTARRALADQFAVSGNHREAIRIYEAMIPSLVGDDRTAVLHNLATIYHHEGRRAEAIVRWREAYEIDPGDPAIRSSFSQALARDGDLESAVDVSHGRPIVAAAGKSTENAPSLEGDDVPSEAKLRKESVAGKRETRNTVRPAPKQALPKSRRSKS